MIRIIDGRGSGKTSRLLLLAKENNAVLVCSNPRAMKYKAEKYGINDIEFISYKEFYDGQTEDDKLYIIDELENYVMNTCGYNIIAYSLSLEE